VLWPHIRRARIGSLRAPCEPDRGEQCAKHVPRFVGEPVGCGTGIADREASGGVVTVRDELLRYYRDEQGRVHLLL
jgi:hypothetical protein